MSRKGRILFSILLASLVTGACFPELSGAGGRDCASRILESFGGENPHTKRIHGLEGYNERIKIPLSKIPLSSLPDQFRAALEGFRPVASDFPREEFLEWYRTHPIPPAEYEEMIRGRKTLGEALHSRARLFEEAHPALDLEKTAQEFQEKVRALRESCGPSLECERREIEALARRMWKGSCLAENPIAIQGMVANLAITNAGYLESYYDQGGKKPFAWDLFANNVIWTPILAEMGCRNALSRGKIAGDPIEVKKPLTYQHAFQGFFKGAGRDYLGYLKLSPVIEASYQGTHLLFEKMQGHEVDLDPSHLALQFGSYLAYDAVYGVPRLVFVNDRILLRGGSVLQQDLIRSAGPKVGKILYLAPDAGARVFLTAKSADLFKWWEENSEKAISTK